MPPHGATAEGAWDGDAPIAAFAVSKGGVVLKHIFLNAPPPDTATTARGGVGASDGEDDEEDPPVKVGRHPECHVLVDHPSVSRFHLELRCRRRQRRITVTDLCSVHGTWVSERRIPPSTPVDLAAGDTLRLGVSKREYRLLWLSLREALEMDDPLHMPPLPEEDKEQPPAYEETSQQIVSEDIGLPAKVASSAPPLPEFTHPIFACEPSVSQFHEETDVVTEDKLVDKNPISESFGSLIIQKMSTTMTSAGKSVQSGKLGISNQVSKSSKLKPVKSLHIDTGRSRDRSCTMSSSFQKEEQREIPVCSQSCGTECAACIALFGISDFERAEEKEEVIAEGMVHMNPPACITMEGSNKDASPENYIPQDSVNENLQKRLSLFDSALLLPFKNDAFANKEILQWNDAIVNTESVLTEMKHGGLIHLNMEGSVSNKENMGPDKIAEGTENCQLDGTACGNLLDNLDAEGTEENEQIDSLENETITPNVSGNIIIERSKRGLKPAFSQGLMDSISPLNLDQGNFSENENSMLNTGDQMISNESISENLNLLISAGENLQKSHMEFKDDILQDRKTSVLASVKYEVISPVRQEDMFSDKENVTPASKVKPNIRRVLGSRMDYSVSAAVGQEDLLSDKENVTPASKVKPDIRRVLGSRMDNSMSTANTSSKKKCNELSAKSEKFHTVDSDVFYSDKENLTPVSSGGVKARKCLPKNLAVELDQDQEAFCSEKENLTPISSAPRKTWDMSENRARVESAITKKRVADRVPFQTLPSNSPLRPATSDCSCDVARPADNTGDLVIKLEDKLNNLTSNTQESGTVGQGGVRAWTMVANTDSLLDDESWKAIMLLKGIKGTYLFIPRIVIRELDSMKQREGLFRRPTKATSILQWIEECMATESWWIHVQSSSEMLPVAPTPPATPSAQSIDEEINIGSGSSSFNPMMAFFSPGSCALADIMSPKPEDRVLDCALLLNRLRSGHGVVVLSNSVTLKIKAMAEGMVCEGAKEFRESLMNPCSSRFMWAASVPRGLAWSRLDAAALAENYYNSHHHAYRRRRAAPARPGGEAAAKGLKLILRHNSLYAQATDAVMKPTPTPPLVTLASV